MTYDPTKDPYKYYRKDAEGSGTLAAVVVPSDITDLSTYAKALYIGGAGDVTVIPVGQTASVTFKNHPVGYFIGCRVARVLSTGTTATFIVAIYD